MNWDWEHIGIFAFVLASLAWGASLMLHYVNLTTDIHRALEDDDEVFMMESKATFMRLMRKGVSEERDAYLIEAIPDFQRRVRVTRILFFPLALVPVIAVLLNIKDYFFG
jgi:hypothetical protein